MSDCDRELAIEAATVRAVLEVYNDLCLRDFHGKYGTYNFDEAVYSRFSPDAQVALDKLIADAKLAEAKWWQLGHICDNSKDCEGCNRIADMEGHSHEAKT